MTVAANVKHDRGFGFRSNGDLLHAEQLLVECEIPLCKRTEIGSTSNGRRGCCVGLSMSGRSQAQERIPIVLSRSASFQAVARFLCSMVKRGSLPSCSPLCRLT